MTLFYSFLQQSDSKMIYLLELVFSHENTIIIKNICTWFAKNRTYIRFVNLLMLCCGLERLWSPLDKLASDPKQVTARLARFRCLLNQRGVAAAPLAGLGRAAPSEPGSCIKQ